MTFLQTTKVIKIISYALICSTIVTTTWAGKDKLRKYQAKVQAEHEASLQYAEQQKQKLEASILKAAIMMAEKNPGSTISQCPYCMRPAPFPSHNNGRAENSCGALINLAKFV